MNGWHGRSGAGQAGRMTGPAAEGVRVDWAGLPAAVRAAVEQACGSPVARAVTQPGGFSPGAAARLSCADGRRFFVKAVSAEANPDAVKMHRRESRVLAALGPICALVGCLTSWALKPAPPGLPTLRGFQAAQGQIARGWLAGLI